MQTKDHYILAKSMAKHLGIQKQKNRFAFVIGNIMPDIDKLSYVQGYMELKKNSKKDSAKRWRISHREKLTWNDHRCMLIGGHTAEGARRYINRKYRQLLQKKRFTLWDYYKMGKMMHYIVDSFTHPHTMEFEDGFFAHVSFEEKLHAICKQCTEDIWRILHERTPHIDLSTLYRAYRSEPANPYNDYIYILTAYINCMNHFMELQA